MMVLDQLDGDDVVHNVFLSSCACAIPVESDEIDWSGTNAMNMLWQHEYTI